MPRNEGRHAAACQWRATAKSLLASAVAIAAIALAPSETRQQPTALPERPDDAAAQMAAGATQSPGRSIALNDQRALGTLPAVVGTEPLIVQPILNVTSPRLDRRAVRSQLAAVNDWFATASGGLWQPRIATILPAVYTDGSACDKFATQAENAWRDATDNGTLADGTFVALLETDTCDWGGLAAYSGNWVYVAGMRDSSFSLGVLIHELGHTLGLPHAGTRECSGGSGGSCHIEEYGNRDDPMGDTGRELPDGTFQPLNLWRLGWLPNGSVERIDPGETHTVTFAADRTRLTIAGEWAVSFQPGETRDQAGIAIEQIASVGNKQHLDLRIQPQTGRWLLEGSGHWRSDDGKIAVKVTRLGTNQATVEIAHAGPNGNTGTDRWGPWGELSVTATAGNVLLEGHLNDPAGIDRIWVTGYSQGRVIHSSEPQTLHPKRPWAGLHHRHGRFVVYLQQPQDTPIDRFVVSAVDGEGNRNQWHAPVGARPNQDDAYTFTRTQVS